MSGFSDQHIFMSCMYCGGAACWLTDGRNNGGGCRSLCIISETFKNRSVWTREGRSACSQMRNSARGSRSLCINSESFKKIKNGLIEPRHEKTCLFHMRTTKAQNSLRIRLLCSSSRCLGKWFEPPHDKTNKITCAPSEDSDEPGHPPSLIRVFTVRSIGS